MVPQHIFDQVDRLADRTGHAAAFSEYAAVCERREAAAGHAADAVRLKEEICSRKSETARRTACGEAVSIESIRENDQADRDAELAVAHFREAVVQLDLLWREKHDALTVASGEIFRPAYDLGVTLRVEAARQADIARAALAEASAKYEAATGLIQVASSRGCKPPQGCYHVRAEIVNTEAAEKKMWAVPHYPHGIALSRAE